MGLASLAREARQQRADDALVVGVREDGEDGALGLRGRGVGRDGGERGGEAEESEDAHACTLQRGRVMAGGSLVGRAGFVAPVGREHSLRRR